MGTVDMNVTPLTTPHPWHETYFSVWGPLCIFHLLYHRQKGPSACLLLFFINVRDLSQMFSQKGRKWRVALTVIFPPWLWLGLLAGPPSWKYCVNTVSRWACVGSNQNGEEFHRTPHVGFFAREGLCIVQWHSDTKAIRACHLGQGMQTSL